MRWLGSPIDRDGLVSRRFVVESENRQVPGVIWSGLDIAAAPLVLVGHGGSGDKFSERVQWLADRIVRKYGCSVAAIDGPAHGDRRSDRGQDPSSVFADFRVEMDRESSIDTMVADWRATLDSLRHVGLLGNVPVGYWGVSMGTLYGIPWLAVDLRIDVAVLGLWGMHGPGEGTRTRLVNDAAAVKCPVLFLAQMNDEHFPCEGVINLFGCVGADDKRLHLKVGGHEDVPRDELESSISFLVDRLGVQSSSP